MDERLQRDIEAVIGPLTEDDRGRYATLNDLDDATVSSMRRLDRLAAVAAIRFLVDRASRRFAELFVADVVVGGASPVTWLRGRIIVPSLSITDQLTVERADVLTAVGQDFDRHVPPDRAAWDAGVSWVGAPCRVDAGSTYFDLDEPLKRGVSIELRSTEPVGSRPVTVRRWHAARLARVMNLDGLTPVAEAEACRAVGVDRLEDLSADGRIAVAALQAEIDLVGGLPGDAVFGFRGPDSLYRPDLP